MYRLLKLSLVLAIGLFFVGCAVTSLDRKVSTKKARIIFFVPKTVSPETVQKKLYEAISFRVSNIKENENFFPEQLPDKPNHPKELQMFSKLSALSYGNPNIEMMKTDTSNAFYTVQGEGSTGSPFYKNLEFYKGAIYPYKDGYKVYLYMFYKEGTDGLMGAITKKVSDTILGRDDMRLLYVAQIRDEFLENLPEAKIES